MCEIICRIGSCDNVPVKLSSTKQKNEYALPKFNVFNFERHIQTQHLNKKRKQTTSLGFSTPVKRMTHSTPKFGSPNVSSLHRPCDDMTPKTATVHQLKTELSSAHNLIKELQMSGAQNPSEKENYNASALTPKTERIQELKRELNGMKEENIILRHKWMEERSYIHTFCRIKPSLSDDTFSWERSKDGTSIKLSK